MKAGFNEVYPIFNVKADQVIITEKNFNVKTVIKFRKEETYQIGF